MRASRDTAAAAGIDSGPVLRRVDKGGRVGTSGLGAQSIFETVAAYGRRSGVGKITPHDLRRTFAKLAHQGRRPPSTTWVSPRTSMTPPAIGWGWWGGRREGRLSRGPDLQGKAGKLGEPSGRGARFGLCISRLALESMYGVRLELAAVGVNPVIGGAGVPVTQQAGGQPETTIDDVQVRYQPDVAEIVFARREISHVATVPVDEFAGSPA